MKANPEPMAVTLSVIIPTHAPHPGRLARTLAGLEAQTCPRERWELILVDNASPDAGALARLDLGWHPQARVVREEQLGLTYARLAGARAAAGELLLYADDDNVLAPNYVADAVAVFAARPQLGIAGGKSLPEWEAPPPDWVLKFPSCLALRDLGEQERVGDRASYLRDPAFGPIGAGMVLRRAVLEEYARQLGSGAFAYITDRRGKDLTSGGDSDIVLTALGAGWQVGYFPQLSLRHLIPTGRTTQEYLGRISHALGRAWVQVLSRHNVCPWGHVSRWVVPFHKLRAYWRNRAWRDPVGYVLWRETCGHFEGRASLAR
jgi:glycosyltransferase involved in cell wall biosynthesis